MDQQCPKVGSLEFHPRFAVTILKITTTHQSGNFLVLTAQKISVPILDLGI
jgi:hypothetical protein